MHDLLEEYVVTNNLEASKRWKPNAELKGLCAMHNTDANDEIAVRQMLRNLNISEEQVRASSFSLLRAEAD